MSSKNYLDKNGLTYFWGKVQNEISPKANTSDILTKTNTTSYTPSANYHPATKKYVDDKGFADLSDVFVITCSIDGSNNHVVDKTWTEITTAINAGKDVYIKCFDYYLYPLTGFEASGSTQGYASFYAPFTWGDGSLENYTVTVWDITFSGNTHSPWEDNTGTSPVLYFDVSYWNDSYTIGSGVTATDLYTLINSGAIVVLKYSGLYYHLSQYYDMDEIALCFVSDNEWSFAKFTVTDRLGTTTITYTYESKESFNVSSPSDGQVLTYDNTNATWVNADVPKEAVVVKITGSDSNGYTANKTFAELRTAHIAGQPIVLRYSTMTWHLYSAPATSSSSTSFVFGTLVGGTSYYWTINSSNAVTKTTLQAVSSVNGQTGAVTLSIPTKTSDLTNDSGYITSSSVPTKTSDLTNDSGFVTTDTNTTYTISISGNVITLTPSTGTAQTITLPVYNGGVT